MINCPLLYYLDKLFKKSANGNHSENFHLKDNEIKNSSPWDISLVSSTLEFIELVAPG